MQPVPLFVIIAFICTTVLGIFLFTLALPNQKRFSIIATAWLLVQGIISYTGFYTVTNTTPPRFALVLMPPLVCIAVLFSTKNGRVFIDSLNAKYLMLVHIIRIPVEFCLYFLFVYKAIPESMTFEGHNFDILSGITAIAVFYFGYVKKLLSRTILIAWNIACLFLLVNIVVTAILSAPFPFQQFAFDQPNVAILIFPFVWLPGFLVPMVLFSHLATIRGLLIKKEV